MFTVYKSANGSTKPQSRVPLVVSPLLLVGLPSGPCLGRGSGVFPHPTRLRQKGYTPHPTGTARVTTYGKKPDSFPKSAVARPVLVGRS